MSGSRLPITDHEKRVRLMYEEVGRKAYELGVHYFEHIGENGASDESPASDGGKPDKLLWGNGHHMAQHLQTAAQRIFARHLPEADLDLICDLGDRHNRIAYRLKHNNQIAWATDP